MPQVAIHKSKEKKRKGGAGAENEYARRLQNLDENKDTPIGRITKMLRADRFMVTFYDISKKQIIEVQAAVVDKNIQRLKPNAGHYVVPVEASKEKFEIYLVLNDEDARRRSDRIPKQILNVSFAGSSTNDDVGIVFEAEDAVEVSNETEEEKRNKRDKIGKHIERVLIEGNEVKDENVNVDDI